MTQKCIKTHCDSQNDIHLVNYQVYHERKKYVGIRLYFIRDVLESKEIMVQKVALEDNSTDVFTKSLPRSRFKYCLNSINLFEDDSNFGENNKVVGG